MDWIDKKIFINNYNDEVTSGDLIKILENTAKMMKIHCGENMRYPSLYPNDIQRLKQVIWICEENADRYYSNERVVVVWV